MEDVFKPQKIKSKSALVKGRLNPDTNTYSINIPQEIRDFLGIKGGEFFSMRGEIKGDKKRIKIKIEDYVEE